MVLEFFKKFFGTAHGAAAEPDSLVDIAAGLDIDAAIAAHQNWKMRLTAYLEGRSTEDLRPEVICFDDRCDLGKWIHSSGQARLGAYAGFTALKEHHRMFHYSASNVVSLVQGGKREEAERMLTGTYEQKSKAVVRSLQQMQQIAASQRR